MVFMFNQPGDRVTGTPTVQSGTAATGYEPTYLTDWTDENNQHPAMMTGTTGAWQVAFGGNQRIDIVVLQHNFDASLACDFRGGGTFGSPTLTAPFTIGARRADGYSFKNWIDLRTIAGYTTSGFTNWWLNVSGTNSVPIGAKLWLGTIVRQLNSHFELTNTHLETDTVTSILLNTDAGPVWGYNLLTNPRLFTGKQILLPTDIQALRDWHRSCGGRALMSLMVPDSSKQDAWLVRWINDVSRGTQGVAKPTFDPAIMIPTTLSGGAFEVTVALEEVTSGLPEWQ